MKDMKEMMSKKSKEKDPMQKEAKLSALSKLRKEMSSLMQDDLGGKMSKVVVAAKDKEGLKKGLDKAEEMLEEPEMERAEEEMGEDLDGDMEIGEDSEHQDKVVGKMDLAEIEEMMSKLAEMKKKLQG